MIHRFFVALFCLVLCSCGYRLANQEPIGISVPFIEGDKTGLLTQAIATELSRSSRFYLSQNHAKLCLLVRIAEDRFDDIGYQYDVKPTSDQVLNRLIATETRRTIRAFVSIVRASDQTPLMDAFEVNVSSDFEYVNSDSLADLSFEADGQTQNVLNFSLGQLDAVEGAKMNSIFPIAREIAAKIVQGLEPFERGEEA